jgi:hypothetical protein
MVDAPEQENGMFFVGMKFAPTENLKQSELNRLVIHLFRRIFMRDGAPLEVKEHESSMLSLVQFLVDLDIRLTEEAFAEIPTDLRRYFSVIHRDGVEYRYGQKPRRF